MRLARRNSLPDLHCTNQRPVLSPRFALTCNRGSGRNHRFMSGKWAKSDMPRADAEPRLWDRAASCRQTGTRRTEQ